MVHTAEVGLSSERNCRTNKDTKLAIEQLLSSTQTLRVNDDCCCLLSCENIIHVHLSCALAMLGLCALRQTLARKKNKYFSSGAGFKVRKMRFKMAFKMEEGAGEGRKAFASPAPP